MLCMILVGLAVFILAMFVSRWADGAWGWRTVIYGIVYGAALGGIFVVFLGAPIASRIGRSFQYQWVRTEKVMLAPWSYDEEPDRIYIVRPEPKIYYLGTGAGRYFYKKAGGRLKIMSDNGRVEIYHCTDSEPFLRVYTRQVVPKRASYCKWLALCWEDEMRYEFHVQPEKIIYNFIVAE